MLTVDNGTALGDCRSSLEQGIEAVFSQRGFHVL
jgi:hypothetical protein